MYGVRYNLHPPTTTTSLLGRLRMRTALGRFQRIFPFFSLAVPRVYRHEAAELPLLHHFFSFHAENQLFLLSGLSSSGRRQYENRSEYNKGRRGPYLIKLLNLSLEIAAEQKKKRKTAQISYRQ